MRPAGASWTASLDPGGLKPSEALYLDDAYEKAERDNRLDDPAELEHAVLEGAARRVRPKLLTAATMFFGLLPILRSPGTGSDVMKRIAAPMIGGIVTSFALELLVYPAVYHPWKSRVLFGRLRNQTPR